MACGECIEEGFLLVDRVTETAGDEVGQAHTDGVAVRALCQREGGDDMDYGGGEVFAVPHPAVANDIGVHPGAAVDFADRIDHEHVDAVHWQSWKIVAVALKEVGLATEDV